VQKFKRGKKGTEKKTRFELGLAEKKDPSPEPKKQSKQSKNLTRHVFEAWRTVMRRCEGGGIGGGVFKIRAHIKELHWRSSSVVVVRSVEKVQQVERGQRDTGHQ